MEVSNAQRAIWSVLITSLAAPFFASIIEVASMLILDAVAGGSEPMNGRAGEIAVAAFIWSALPATISAIALTPYILQSGTYGWLHAAVAGIVAFGISAIIFPVGSGRVMPVLAFVAGMVAVLMRHILISCRILKSS